MLVQSQAFWMIQATGSDITLSLPTDLPHASAGAQLDCSDSLGCVDLALANKGSEYTWNMLGVPNRESIPEQNISIISGVVAGPCSGGCSISEAFDNELVYTPYWHFDSESLTYIDVFETGQLNPWSGFWILTYPDTANMGLTLQATGIKNADQFGRTNGIRD